MNSKFNAQLASLDEMETVDQEETERLKAFLSLGSFQMDEGPRGSVNRGSAQESGRGSSYVSVHGATESKMTEVQEQEEADPIDWTRVGKVYDQETAIDSVMDREFTRLNKALEMKLVGQDEKILAATQAAKK